MAVTKKALETKERIKNVAAELFATKGYAGTTLREIASAAKVTTGAFYKHYSSKEDLLIGIFNEGFTKEWERFFLLQEEFTPYDYAEMVGKMNKGLADTFGVELLKVYCTAQWEMGNPGSLWKVLDTERFSSYDSALLNKLATSYSSNYSGPEIDEIILKVDRGVLLDWIIKKGTTDIEVETRNMLLLVFRSVFDRWNEK